MADNRIFQVSYGTFKQAATQTTVYHYPIGTDGYDGYVLGTGTRDFVYTTKITSFLDVGDFLTTLFSASVATTVEDDVLALPTIQVNNSVKRYDTGGTDYLYIGSAPIGTLDSDSGWTIERFALDADGNAIDKKITVQNGAVWDDRVTETYF